MIVWAVANQKGGVGKTTTSISLAAGLADSGARVLMLDLDPHGSLTGYCGYHPEQVEPNLYDLFGGDAQHLEPLSTPWPGLSLWAASAMLATLDRRVGSAQGMGLRIRHALGRVADTFDYAILDCPPMLGILMVNALGACDKVLVPVQTEHLAIQGLERMARTLEMIQRSRNTVLDWLVIPTLFDRRTRASRNALERLRQSYRVHIWPGLIPADTRFRDASSAGQPIQHFAARSRGALAYAELLAYLRDPRAVVPDRAAS